MRIIFSLVLLTGAAAPLSAVCPSEGSWPSGYTNCTPIVIPEDLVCDEAGADSGTLTNFPIPMAFTKAEFATVANGGTVENLTTSALEGISIPADMRFQNAAGTKLDVEWTDYTATTGAIALHAEDPSLSCSAGVEVYAYTGNASQTATEETAIGSVWGAYTKLVAGLEQDPASVGAGGMLDSLGNNNGTDANNPASTAGVFGQGVDFESSAATSIEWGTGTELQVDAADFSYSMWVRFESFPAYQQLFTNRNTSTCSACFDFEHNTAGSINGTIAVFRTTASGWRWNLPVHSASTGVWYHYAATYDRDGSLTLYVNGAQQGTVSIATWSATDLDSSTLLLGRDASAGYADAAVDELRFTAGLYSLDWVRTEYNAYNSLSTFAVPGTTESGGAPDPPTVMRLEPARR